VGDEPTSVAVTLRVRRGSGEYGLGNDGVAAEVSRVGFGKGLRERLKEKSPKEK